MRTLILALLGLIVAPLQSAPKENPTMPQGLHSFTVPDINGRPADLSLYRGKVILVVNVASECGYTSQYQGLESLHRHYREQGFSVLGFPCDDFGGQEPGTEAEIKAFCERHYQVSFPLFAKSHAKGEAQSPLFAWLTSQPGHTGKVTWNFNKFLIGKDGQLIARWGSSTKPGDKELAAAIEEALKR